MWPRPLVSNARSCAKRPAGFWPSGWLASRTLLAAGPRAVLPPEVAIPVVRLACVRPDRLDRRLSQWDGAALARQRVAAGLVSERSAATMRRIWAAPQLTPWRHHLGRYAKHPRAGGLSATVAARIALYTRPRRAAEMGRSLDEKTSRQPRPRLAPTRPAQPQNRPNQYEHDDKRAGALTLVAAFATRSGCVYGQGDARNRQQEGIACREHLAPEMAERLRTIPRVCDHVSTHHGNEVTRWFAQHPRVVVHCTPVHGSWMNQVEPWCRIWQRQRLRLVDFISKAHGRVKLAPCIRAWNQQAHPFNWSTTSVTQVMAQASAMAA